MDRYKEQLAQRKVWEEQKQARAHELRQQEWLLLEQRQAAWLEHLEPALPYPLEMVAKKYNWSWGNRIQGEAYLRPASDNQIRYLGVLSDKLPDEAEELLELSHFLCMSYLNMNHSGSAQIGMTSMSVVYVRVGSSKRAMLTTAADAGFAIGKLVHLLNAIGDYAGNAPFVDRY